MESDDVIEAAAGETALHALDIMIMRASRSDIDKPRESALSVLKALELLGKS